MSERSLIILSAESAEELRLHAGELHLALAEELSREIAEAGTPASAADPVADLAAKLALGTPGRYRAAILTATLAELCDLLVQIRDDTVAPDARLAQDHVGIGDTAGASRPLFLYPGQGSQRRGENAALAALYPGFHAYVRELEESFTSPPLSAYLSEAWGTDPDPVASAETSKTDIAQPLLTVMALATTRALGELGVLPTLTLGHSVGECGALSGAGLLDSGAVCELISQRVQCTSATGHGTALLAVTGSLESVQELIAESDGVSVACDNGPEQVVIGGSLLALEQVRHVLDEHAVRYTALPAAAAFHTPFFAEADAAFDQALGETDGVFDREQATATCISTVSTEVISDGDQARAVLARQLASPVRFREAAQAAQENRPTVLIQVSGGSGLIALYRRCNPEYSGPAIGLGGPQDSRERLLTAVGELFLAVAQFRPAAILGRQGIASRALHQPATARGSVAVGGSSITPTGEAVIDAAGSGQSPIVRADTAPTAEPAPQATVPVSAPGVIAAEAAPAVRSTERVGSAIPYISEVVDLLKNQLSTLERLLGPSALGLPAAAPGAGSIAQHHGTGGSEALGGPVAAAGGDPVTAAAAPAGAGSPVQPVAEAGAIALKAEEVGAQVRAVIARIGGYEPSDIDLDLALDEGLGFDSLMVTSLCGELSRDYPHWVPTADDIGTLRTARDMIAAILAAQPAAAQASAPAGDALPAPEVRPAPGENTPAIPGSAAAAAPIPVPEQEDLPATPVADHSAIDSLPEILEMAQRLDEGAALEDGIPYYVEHESAATATTLISGESYLSFSSYNYLGLADHPSVRAATCSAVESYGTSASAARILSGNRPIHRELEEEIAALIGAEDAVTLVGGHGTNMSIIPHLYSAGDIIFYDSLAHDSLHQGMKASGATRHSFPHNRVDVLAAALRARRHRFRRALVITEGVFSMDGDLPDLRGILDVAHEYGAHVMVDEAHSVGVLGATGGGICEELGVDPGEVDLLMGTLSKSLASCGGYLAGSHSLINYLRFTLSGLIFSAGMSPANTAAALTAIRVMRAEPERLLRLRANARYFLEGARARSLEVGTAVGVPVIPVILGDSDRAVAVAQRLFREHISVNPIIYPAVANAEARLRFFLTSEHTQEQLEETLDQTARIVAQTDAA